MCVLVTDPRIKGRARPRKKMPPVVQFQIADVDAARGEDNPDSFNVVTTEMEDLADRELRQPQPSEKNTL